MKISNGFWFWLALLAALFAGLLLATRGEGAEPTYDYRVCWVPPTQKTDGTALTDLAGYRIFWGATPTVQTTTRDVMNPGATCVTITLPRRTWYWHVVALNTTGASSAPSNVPVLFLPGDTDGDAIEDFLDNCTLVKNASQVDSDADAYGNACDGDLNGDRFTNAADTVLFRAQLGMPSPAPVYNPADFNANGFVNAQDHVLLRQLLGKPPGPSGWH